jgi:hypothetical protein
MLLSVEQSYVDAALASAPGKNKIVGLQLQLLSFDVTVRSF